VKIVIAPNAFKDSISAVEAAIVIEQGIRNVMQDCETIKIPIADGGDGLVDIALHSMNGEKISCVVRDPLLREISADFCYLPKKETAIIEMASASGLRLLHLDDRNPMKTSTAGTGDLIRAALDLNVRKILVGLGGSATNDGGCGMASALGVDFRDKNNLTIKPTGETLKDIRALDISRLDKRVHQTSIEAICDVSNVLLGNKGAASVYAPQKGASAAEVKLLEQGLENIADLIQSELKINTHKLTGGGAAGGLGAGLYSFLGAKLRPGADVVLDLMEIDTALEGCDLVITAEGQIDEQTVFGKAPAAVAKRAQKRGIPCIAFAGSRSLNLNELHKAGFTAIFSICPGPVSLGKAIENVRDYLQTTTGEALRCFISGSKGAGP